jgi:hypothetical protein
VFRQSDFGCESVMAHFAPKTYTLVYAQVFSERLLAPQNLVTNAAGRIAHVNVKVIIAGGSGGVRFVAHAANVTAVTLINLFGRQRDRRRSPSRGGRD